MSQKHCTTGNFSHVYETLVGKSCCRLAMLELQHMVIWPLSRKRCLSSVGQHQCGSKVATWKLINLCASRNSFFSTISFLLLPITFNHCKCLKVHENAEPIPSFSSPELLSTRHILWVNLLNFRVKPCRWILSPTDFNLPLDTIHSPFGSFFFSTRLLHKSQ